VLAREVIKRIDGSLHEATELLNKILERRSGMRHVQPTLQHHVIPVREQQITRCMPSSMNGARRGIS
jgi:hypothetical protein